MKLLRAHIENFRLLRDLTIEFATDRTRNVTVIRAANESGKTTLLTALQWGLFGDSALPNLGADYRLSPLDITGDSSVTVPISVEIDYEVPTRAGQVQQYRIIRSALETPRTGGTWERHRAKVRLINFTPAGTTPLDNPEAHIRPHLPNDLREVFFTDGDRALSFIEGSRADQMKRVAGAIQSLLGFETVENAREHAQQVGSALNRRVRKDLGSRDELQKIADKLASLEQRLPLLEADIRDSKEALDRLEELEHQADKTLTEALRQGNKDELIRGLADTKRKREVAQREAAQAARDHANLFRSELLAKHLLATPFDKARALLETLHNQRQIPSQTIPVLEDRLDFASCICGESLDDASPEGRRRRGHIAGLIEESRAADENREKLTALYYGSQDLLKPPLERIWKDEYADVFQRRVAANKRTKDYGEQEAEIDAQIARLPDIDIRQLRAARDRYRSQAKEEQARHFRATNNRDTVREEMADAESQREKQLSRDQQGMKLAAELQVAKDLQHILAKTLDTMRTRELEQVSERMNALFLDMIGADAAEKAIIRRAAITPDFRIVVSGPYDQPLDPSQDLNGASRRALTIAFILALAQVSEVEAPNVIDTPLGMMSGYVKQAVLQLASQHSGQLVLMLTHSEISECEDILDRRAGRIYTLTNPAHYPNILVNDPGTADSRLLVCDCNHRRHCSVCERRESPERLDGEAA
ncbi:MAG: AAA family ATPase [Gammaproteobacteria bacterium]|nr:AAA family ATPase [Gammaproteobacteria bacterium]